MAGFSSRYQRYLDMPEEKFERAIKDFSPSELEGLQKALAAKQDRLSRENKDFESGLWAGVFFVAAIVMIVVAVQALGV